MKVFLILAMADGQTGPAIEYAFKQLGHTTEAIDARLQTNGIYEAYCKFKAELVVCTKTPEVTDQVRHIKQKFNPIICMWNPDSRKNIDIWKRLFPLIRIVDYNFVIEYSQIPEWRERINPNTFWLPQGVQNEVYHKPKKITEEDRKKYACDVCFAGRIPNYRVPFFRAVDQMGVNFKKWGSLGAPKIYNEEHNKMVALSKINLGCSGPGSLSFERNISVRDYKILGAGGFLMEFYRDSLKEIFPLGVLDYYKNPRDLVMKIKYWLAHDEERKVVAEKGYKWVCTNATYTHRIKMALDYMGINS